MRFTTMRFLKSLVLIASAVSIPLVPQIGFAQDFPSKRVTMVVPFAAGGGTDLAARVIAERLSERWKQPVIVENRPGAGGLIGTAAVAKSPADGYTILFNSTGFTLAAVFNKDVPFDPLNALKGTAVISAPLFLFASPSMPDSVKDFMRVAQQKPKAVSYGVIPFSSMAVDMRLFEEQLKAEMLEVPLNSAVPAVTMLITGELNLWTSFWGPMADLVKAGKAKPLGIASAQRSKYAPSVPTFIESGLDYKVDTWFALFVPAKTPQSILERISTDAALAVRSPEAEARLTQLGLEAYTLSPSETDSAVQSLYKKYKSAADRFGIQPR